MQKRLTERDFPVCKPFVLCFFQIRDHAGNIPVIPTKLVGAVKDYAVKPVSVHTGFTDILPYPTGFRFGMADGKEIVGFEVAGADGLYHKATATIKNGKVILESKKVKQPCAVRYGWQAFTTANLVNGKGFPASTFREENIGVSK